MSPNIISVNLFAFTFRMCDLQDQSWQHCNTINLFTYLTYETLYTILTIFAQLWRSYLSKNCKRIYIFIRKSHHIAFLFTEFWFASKEVFIFAKTKVFGLKNTNLISRKKICTKFWLIFRKIHKELKCMFNEL